MEYHRGDSNLKGGNKLPFPVVHSWVFCYWQPPNTAIILHTQKLGNPGLLRYVCVRVCSRNGDLGLVERCSSINIGKTLISLRKIQMVQILFVPRMKR